MRALRDYLINEIKTRLPEFKDVRMWNNQFSHSNNDEIENNDEKPFGYPCCFVELDIQEIRSVALGVKYVDVNIILHIGLEEYSTEREQDYDFIDLVDSKMTGMRGSEIDTVQFSSLREAITDLDEDFNNVNEPVLTYSTTYTKLNSYSRSGLLTKQAPTGKNITGEII